MGVLVQSYDNRTGSFSASGFYACRALAPWTHKLKKARVFCLNCVTTGTVNLTLRFTDKNGGRGGTAIGIVLENDDLDAQANILNVWEFDLDGYENLTCPEDREYFIQGSATDSADRLDELVLALDMERVS